MGHQLSKEGYKELCKSTSQGRINFHDRVTIINRLNGRIQRGKELMSEELEALFRLKEPVDKQVIDEDMDSVFCHAVFKIHDKFYMAYYFIYKGYDSFGYPPQVLIECRKVTKTIEVFELI